MLQKKKNNIYRNIDTNLTYTVGIQFTLKQLARVQLSPSPKGVIIGILLSDG